MSNNSPDRLPWTQSEVDDFVQPITETSFSIETPDLAYTVIECRSKDEADDLSAMIGNYLHHSVDSAFDASLYGAAAIVADYRDNDPTTYYVRRAGRILRLGSTNARVSFDCTNHWNATALHEEMSLRLALNPDASADEMVFWFAALPHVSVVYEEAIGVAA